MTQEHHKRLAELLQLFNTVEPEEMEALDKEQWRPFLASLNSDHDRVFALTAYFDMANYNLSRLANRIGQLTREDFEVLQPALEGFKTLEDQF
ncbi:MAG: hypothetical protein Q7T20_15095, partial [Saprospiraceae bacterium]|nr:hypothetical protein [Saprospiraceae bacterium]